MKYKLQDIFEFIRNGANIKQGTEGGYPITRIETISDRVINRNKMGYAGIFELSKYEDYLLKDGDILMSHINSEVHLGKSAIYEKENQEEKIIHGMNLLCLRPKKDILYPKFAYYYFNTRLFNIKLNKIIKKSVNQASFSVTDLKKFEVNIPHKSIQIKIANTLDKAQELINKRRNQIEELDQLTQSVFIEMFGDIRTNSKGFKCVKLNKVVNEISTGKSLAGEGISAYKVLKTSAVSYKFFKKDEAKYLPQDYIPPVSHLVNKGDILVSRMNTIELVGAAAYVFDDVKNIALPDRIWKLHYNDQINPIFLWYFINQTSFRDKVSEIATGTSGSMKNISQQKYLNLDILLPEITLQNKFAEIFNSILNQKIKMDISLNELNNTFNSLIQRAFKGELFIEEKVLNS
jgi:type I restriction enzyme S subunit